MSNQDLNEHFNTKDENNHKSIGIYCTVSSDELQLALKTLSIAAKSKFVTDIIILITDIDEFDSNAISFDLFRENTEKINIFNGNYGYGYETSIQDGGYDQISARNDALRIIYSKKVDWIMQHDADDIYDLDFYEKVCLACSKQQAIMTECYTLNSFSTYVVNGKLLKNIYGQTLLNPHIRIWKRELALEFKKSRITPSFYVNETRHCGVEFPDGMKFIIIKKPSHYHLHRLLNKRHSSILDKGETHEIKLNDDIKEHLKTILP
ncbi:hypothetical protein IBT49_26955 [Erwinia sp. S63]|uniref:hypothetical protein n=1 Tax=Erwinia sp. S63 TaxID=2769341 RepID=UPI00190C12A4|nr:hypothetical protein [Erwinia sp. S63]MBK0099636.1 hypothetical protein [Erwinia sp. S63]